VAVGAAVLAISVCVVDHYSADNDQASCDEKWTARPFVKTPPDKEALNAGQRKARDARLLRKTRILAKKQGKAPSLESQGTLPPVNVTGTEGLAIVELSMAASPSLVRGLKSGAISVEIPQNFRRVDEKSSTQYLPRAKHSSPKIAQSRKAVSFKVCVDLGEGSVAGGTYVTQVYASALGYESGVATVTINVKDSDWFVKAGVFALLFAFVLLLFQAGQAEWIAQGERPGGAQSRSKALKRPIKDIFGFWPTTVASIGAVAFATWAVYAANPAWGSDHVGSGIGLIGTAVAAAGVGNLVTVSKTKSGGDQETS
jgi:hypothetical protein